MQLPRKEVYLREKEGEFVFGWSGRESLPASRDQLPLSREKELLELRTEIGHLTMALDRQRKVSVQMALCNQVERQGRNRAESAWLLCASGFTQWFDSVPVPMACVGQDGLILRVNHYQVNLLGYVRAELVGRPIGEVLQDSKLVEDILKALEGKTSLPKDRVARVRCRNGDVKPVRVFCEHLAQGVSRGICCWMHDLSELDRIRSDQQSSEQFFGQMAEHIREVFWMSTPDKQNILYVSPGYEEVWGRSRESLYQRPSSFLDAIYPEDRDRVVGALPLQVKEGGYCEDYRVVRPDQSIRWIRDRAFPVRDEAGHVYRVVGLAEDVTDLKEAEERLRNRSMRQEILAQIGWLALTEPCLQKVFEGTITHLARAFQLEFIHIFEFKPETNRLRLRAGRGWPTGRGREMEVGSGIDAFLSSTLYAKKPLLVNDLETDNRFTASVDLCRDQGIVSGINAPIEGREHPFGVMGVCAQEARVFSHEDATFVQAIAHILAAAIERRAAETRQQDLSKKLAEQKKKLDRLLDTLPVLVWELRLNPLTGELSQDYASEYSEKMLDYPREELMAHPELWQERLHPEDRNKVNEEMAEILAGGKPPPIQFRWVGRDGRIVWIESSKQLVTDELGKPVGLRGFAVDVTDRKREEARREEAEERFLSMLGNIPGVVWELRLDEASGQWLPSFISDYMETLLGYPKQFWMKNPQFWVECIHSEDRERVRETMRRVVLDGKSAIEQFRWVARDGHLVWVESRKSAIWDATGKVIGVRGVTVDITERKRARAERDAAEERFRLFMDHSPALSLIKDEDGCFIYGNAAFQNWCASLGLDWYGATDLDLFPAELARQYQKHDREALVRNQTTQVLETAYDHDGKPMYWNVLRFPIHSPQGRFLGVVAIDITERRRLEKELLEISDREQSRLGQELHDGLCQHILGIALMSKSLSGRMKKRNLPEAKDVDTICGFLDDALAVTRGLMQGFHLVNVEGPGGLSAALEEFAETTSKLFGRKCRFEPQVRIVIKERGVAAHLFRIAQEATHNAIKHGHPNQVTISLRRVNGSLILAVENDGEPLPEVIAGAGMGMRTMNYRASLIGADLKLENRPGGGVIVSCLLPADRSSQSIEFA
jgi:PAS domain S-box-containing protein